MNSAVSSLTSASFFTKLGANSNRGVALDAEKTDSLSAAQLTQANSSNASPTRDTVTLSNEALTFLLELSQANDTSSGVQPSDAEIFNALDTDLNGTLSQEEFVSGRPKFASESDAITEFSRLDADENGALTLEEVAEGNESSSTSTQAAAGSGGKPPPPPPPPPSGTASTDEIYDELDTNEDGVVDVSELMAGLAEEAEEEAESTGQEDSALSALFSQAINAYTARGNIEDPAGSRLLQSS